MNITVVISIILNILVLVAFIIDRIYRIQSIKEYKEAKEAQIENLKQQLDAALKNNDLEIAAIHMKRVENVKLVLKEKETDIENLKQSLQELNNKMADDKDTVDIKTYQALYGLLIDNYLKQTRFSLNSLEDENEYHFSKKYYNFLKMYDTVKIDDFKKGYKKDDKKTNESDDDFEEVV